MKKQELKNKWGSVEKRDLILVLCMTALLFGLSFAAWGKEEEQFSDSERRILAGRPEISVQNLLDGTFMEKFENYTLDQFPFRDRFRSLKAIVSLGAFLNKDNNKIYYAQGHLSKLEYPLQTEMLDYAANKMQWIYEKYLKEQGSKCFFSIVPDKNYFLAKRNGYLALDYETLFTYMKEKTEFAKYLDLVPFLSLEDYYKTDTHWRQERMVDVAEYLMNSMAEGTGDRIQLLQKEQSDYQETVLNRTENKKIENGLEEEQMTYETKKVEQDFYGVYYGQSALPVQPDEMFYLTNEMLENCIVTSYDTGKAQPAFMYHMEKAKGKDAYELFLEGANALLVIENPAAESTKELLVFRDSFGSSLVPLLVENYSKITVIDIRYVQSAMLGKLVEFQGQDALFLYSTLILNQSMALK